MITKRAEAEYKVSDLDIRFVFAVTILKQAQYESGDDSNERPARRIICILYRLHVYIVIATHNFRGACDNTMKEVMIRNFVSLTCVRNKS